MYVEELNWGRGKLVRIGREFELGGGGGGDKFEVEIREFGDREDMGWLSISLSLQLLHLQIMISHT